MKYLLLALALMPFAIAAESGVEYDHTTGNYYYWFKTHGGYDIYGINAGTGSTWNTHTFTDGSMMGADADNNPWSYNPSTTLYTNQGTGEVCYGLGELRECF